jgi:hypothetical protein
VSRRFVTRSLVCILTLGLTLATAVSADTVSARVRRNPKLPAGADADGRVLLYTPKPIQPGSTHSHFDTSATPNLLMEPSINSDLRVFNVGLTKQAMQDLGWRLGALNVQVRYGDSANQGFNDATLGEARKAALEMAAGAWGLALGSSINVNVEATFAEQGCSDNGATLASAGPQFVFMDFAGGEPGTWYPGSLAESLAGENLSTGDDSNPDAADLTITFNSRIDEECLGEGRRYYYGLDNDVPSGEISFVTVAMHELGHGLGFVGLVNEATGQLFRGFPDIFTALTYDTRKKKHWHEMTDAKRKRSAKRPRKVSFDGAKTTARAGRYLKGRVVVEVRAPDGLAGNYEVGEASFGPKLKKRGINGDLALVNDGSASPTFGCLPLVNGSEIAGKIAVIDRGDCLFTEKVGNAQDVGAVGVIIVHNEAGPPPGLGGSDDSIRIPAVRLGQKDGKKIKRVLRR